MQSALLLQVCRQALTPLQKYGAHDCVGFAQAPPWHVPGIVSVPAPPGQLAVEQLVPSAYCWQPPRPSHLPFAPQLGAPSSAQKLGGASVPAARGEHAPVPDRLHAWQAGQLAEPQHTPSTQFPVMHWPPVVHARPLPLSAQLLPPAAPWHV